MIGSYSHRDRNDPGRRAAAKASAAPPRECPMPWTRRPVARRSRAERCCSVVPDARPGQAGAGRRFGDPVTAEVDGQAVKAIGQRRGDGLEDRATESRGVGEQEHRRRGAWFVGAIRAAQVVHRYPYAVGRRDERRCRPPCAHPSMRSVWRRRMLEWAVRFTASLRI